jgi:hypothetical protein
MAGCKNSRGCGTNLLKSSSNFTFAAIVPHSIWSAIVSASFCACYSVVNLLGCDYTLFHSIVFRLKHNPSFTHPSTPLHAATGGRWRPSLRDRGPRCSRSFCRPCNSRPLRGFGWNVLGRSITNFLGSLREHVSRDTHFYAISIDFSS